MAEPTMKIRTATYERDSWRCVACGRRSNLTYQHRWTEGMGGTSRKPPMSHGIVLCSRCNTDVEGWMQALAFLYGWKVRHHVDPLLVPVFYTFERSWWVLDDTGPHRVRVSARRARELMDAAYSAGGPGVA